MTLAWVQASSSCMKLFGLSCSDICLSLSASVNALAAGSLPLLVANVGQPPSALLVSMACQPASALGRNPWQALIRQGGGYTSQATSEASPVGTLPESH